jgi:hypothetical protein
VKAGSTQRSGAKNSDLTKLAGFARARVAVFMKNARTGLARVSNAGG